jgi:hypothetical protein
MKYGSAEISDALCDAFERCLQHPDLPFHPSTRVDDWLGLPTFSSSSLTMNHFCPRSLGRPPVLHNYPEWSTAYLYHRQSTAICANMSQLVVTTPSFTSPVIGKSDPMQLSTSQSPVIQSRNAVQDDWIGHGCQEEATSPAIGKPDPLPLVTQHSSAILLSPDDPQVKKLAFFHVRDRYFITAKNMGTQRQQHTIRYDMLR